MNKINNIFEETIVELENEQKEINKIANENNEIFKEALNVNITPPALIGSLVGSAIAKKKIHSSNIKKQVEEDNRISNLLNTNYYTQIQNIANHLKVLFTPFGVVFIVKNGTTEVTLETIETSEMNQSMYNAWQSKDSQYFKNVLLNKMHSEIQFTEQQFAKRIIEKQTGINRNINRNASVINADDIGLLKTAEEINKIIKLYSKKNKAIEKLSEMLTDALEKEASAKSISWELPRPIDKISSMFGDDPLSFLKIRDMSKIDSLQQNYLSPSYLKNKVKIGFMPDRVIFIVDGRVMMTLLTIDMSSEGFEAFNANNKNYFIKYFEYEAKRGLGRMKGKVAPNHLPDPPKQQKKEDSGEEKNASDLKKNWISEIFSKTDIHPVIYLLELNKKFTDDWVNWDFEALIKAIESEYNLDGGVKDIPLNKIMSIAILNKSRISYESHHAFEKIIRSFTNKPIDFMEREASDIETYDLAYGLDCMDLVTLHDNIYDNFSKEIFTYIIFILKQNQHKIFMPFEILESKMKDEFYEQLNKFLLDAVINDDIGDITNKETQSYVMQKNEIIHETAKYVLLNINENNIKFNNVSEYVSKIIEKTKHNQATKDIIITQILNNVLADEILRDERKKYQEQAKKYGFTGGESN